MRNVTKNKNSALEKIKITSNSVIVATSFQWLCIHNSFAARQNNEAQPACANEISNLSYKYPCRYFVIGRSTYDRRPRIVSIYTS